MLRVMKCSRCRIRSTSEPHVEGQIYNLVKCEDCFESIGHTSKRMWAPAGSWERLLLSLGSEVLVRCLIACA
uniref:Uncharacterized protein n=1 Tax=Physcomitrium patens TaxID=3218 RepID=A0A2K1L7D3_PHYPA|nr:hypothetical protein PHYPA_000357 [Physcomitrium patens]